MLQYDTQIEQQMKTLYRSLNEKDRRAYPPYTSKYNPIEHRLFLQVTRVCQGVVFHTIEIVRNLMQQTTTRTGLNVFVEIEKKVYETGRKYASDFKTTMRIQFDKLLPKWNDKTIPINN